MFVDVDPKTGRVDNSPTDHCVYSVAEMEAQGFVIIETVRTIQCTEVHYNGPFHLKFKSGVIITADQIDSVYETEAVKSTHRIVLCGTLPDGGEVAFEATKD